MLAGDLERLAEFTAESGSRNWEAELRLHAAQQRLREGRHDVAAAHAERALCFYRSVGATRYIREAEELLAATRAEAPTAS